MVGDGATTEGPSSGMDFSPSAEVGLITNQLDEFIAKEVEPMEQRHDHFLGEDGWENRAGGDGMAVDEFLEIERDIRQTSADAGFLTMHLPERVGGGGVSTLTYTMALEHLHDRHPDGFHGFVMGGVSPTMLRGMVDCYEDDYQRAAYFDPVMDGEKRAAFGLTEPDHGSDILRMDTTAEKCDGEWVIQGTKCFISGAPYADFFVVHARTSGNDGDATGISSFFVNADNPGLEIGKLQTYMGKPVSNHAFVHLEDCCVPDRNRMGAEGRGFIDTALEMVGEARMALAARAVGKSQWMFDRSVEYARTRRSSGEPIGEKQMIQDLLARLRVDIELTRWLYRYAAWQFDRDDETRWLQSAANWKGSELWAEAADTAIQIHGAAGVMSSLPFEREYREARGSRISDGTTQIHKRNIARAFLEPLDGS